MNLRLNTLMNSRKTLGRLLREFHAGKIDGEKFRTMVYGLSSLLQYWKVEKDAVLEDRLEAIEKYISEASK